MEIDLKQIKKIHFIGIGGIGVSALAKMMKSEGKEVSGSDSSESPITEQLATSGIKVEIGQRADNLPTDTELVIHTIAITEDNPELVTARKLGIPTATYPQMLEVISKDLYTIAVSGTHGKTTTTAMLAKVLIDAGLDPTVVVGSLMKDSKSNLVVGHSKYFVVEACEYRRSFLNLHPNILVITNIEEDHLDYYKDLSDIQSAFRELALRVPEDGAVICDTSNPHVVSVVQDLKCKVVDYSAYLESTPELQVPGEHNRKNASCVVAVTDFLKVDEEKTKNALQDFSGTWRRFELLGKTRNGALVYDDYAHHPQEIQATLKGAREMYQDREIVVFFQPHLFSRTKSLLEEFSKSFRDADKVYLLPIYPAREPFDPTISSEMLVDKIGDKAAYLETIAEAEQIIGEAGKGTLVIIMGAGDIYKLREVVKSK